MIGMDQVIIQCVFESTAGKIKDGDGFLTRSRPVKGSFNLNLIICPKWF
jgi:hypothetical protein